MNKLPKTVGAGFGLALAAGAFFSPAQAEAQPARQDVVYEQGFQHSRNDYGYEVCFLLSGFALTAAGVLIIKRPTMKIGNEETDDVYQINSEPLPEQADISELVAVNRQHAARELESIARAYHTMQDAELIEVDAAWIISQAARTDEL